MIPEDDWYDVEWFDCYLWRPQIADRKKCHGINC